MAFVNKQKKNYLFGKVKQKNFHYKTLILVQIFSYNFCLTTKMSQTTKKNRRLCETLQLLKGYKTGQEVAKDRNVKVKSKSKKCAQGTFSMIKFYQSIPNYDEVRHLPEYDFSERVELLKKIHCDLSGTVSRGTCKRPTSSASRGSKRKSSGKKKKHSATCKNAISPSLCNSFSKASLDELDDIGSGNKRSPIDRISSANSLAVSTPPPLKRLQAFREKLMTCNDDWKYDPKYSNELKCPMPKTLSPKLPSPMCSPIHVHSHKLHPYHPMHFHNFDYPCELMHSHFESIHEGSPPCSTDYLKSPPKHVATQVDEKPVPKSPIYVEKCIKPKKKLRRAKSCPKDLFSISSKCSDNEKSQNESIEMNERRLCRDDLTPCYMEFNTPSISRQQHSYPKTIPKIRIQKPNSKTPNSMDEFISSKLVRSNHAAKLRQKTSHKKINELAEKKLKASMHVSQFIPKCHHWNVRDTPAWKTFLSEDLTTEKRLREEARREEQRVRKHTHLMTMNIMRARVKSAQLLLEGRSLSAKY